MRYFYPFYLIGILVVISIACTSSKKSSSQLLINRSAVLITNDSTKIYDSIQIEFGDKLGVPYDSIKDINLYTYIKQSLNKPCGKNTLGQTCEAFLPTLLFQVYNYTLAQNAKQQFSNNDIDLFKNKNYLQTGDIVFFRINAKNKNSIGYSAFYLANNFFLIASKKYGISIQSLEDKYWEDNYFACGRLKGIKSAIKKVEKTIDEKSEVKITEIDIAVKSNNPTKLKWAKKLNTSPDSIFNLKLYAFIDDWLGIPYLWGGTTRRGIDCSAFVQKLYEDVYNIYVPRTSLTQFYTTWVDVYKNTKYLEEGDMVFFKTMKNRNIVTHVGFYLHNGYFVNSSRKGVSLGNLNDRYWASKYVAAGRLKSKKRKN
jgi:cell wall-associated NlpC family hydrolase